MPNLPTYIIITAARDEAKFIEWTLKSVVAQTVLPVRWVIVSDGSTDGTDEIVKRYAADHPWIELVRMTERRERHFGGKANAVNAAYARIRHLQFQAIVSLDGDVSFDESYFDYLLGRLDEQPALGIIGTSFREPKSRPYNYRFASAENVPGPCQLFRRQCFEEIGGYAPMRGGGVDHVALVSARMKGWTTKAFTDRTFFHHRPMGNAQHGSLGASFHYGKKDYSLGNHPAWELFRTVHRMAERPVLVGGLFLAAGYLWAAVRGLKGQVPHEIRQFHRRDQLRRMKMLFKDSPWRKRGAEAGRSRSEIVAGGILGHADPLTVDMRTSGVAFEDNDHSDADPSRPNLPLPAYVLITPARNEAQFIELTMQSVVSQTVRPLKWVIVSDGSNDGTDEIVKKYVADHPWIVLMQMPERRERHFSGKAHAVNAAYAVIRDLEFQVVANLDADISVCGGHFAYLLSKLAQDPALGVVGTPFQEISGETYDYRFVSIEHVSGACQVFRRRCFEEVNGYLPIKGGGVDHAAVISARMKGWETRTFTGMVCLHHRKTGTAERGRWAAWFRTGVKDYRLGGHPLWELSRVIYRITKKPVIIGSLMLGAGYTWALVCQIERPLSRELQAFHRQEQMRRLKSLLTRKTGPSAERLQRPA